MTINRCDLCKGPLGLRETYDIYLSVTRYDEKAEPVKTGMEPEDEFQPDYITICNRRGCRQIVERVWKRLVNTLQLGGEQS
jgi:hypothetical protein